MFAHAHGYRIEVRIHRSMDRHGEELSDANLRKIEQTLRAIPYQHLAGLSRIEIRQRDRAGGSTNPDGPTHGGVPRSGHYFVVLDIDAFDSSWNNTGNGLLYTLLHEMGHVVDWHTRSFEWIGRNDREGYRAIVARTHRGVTQHNQEKFADAYADYFFYRGTARGWTRSVQAVYDSPCFDGLRRSSRSQGVAIA